MKRTILLFGLLLPIALAVRAADVPARPRLVGLAHVAFYAADLNKTRGFYKDFLGFAEPYWITNDDGSLRLTFIKINDRQAVELFPEKQAGSDRLYHVALETENAEAMRQYLASKGVAVKDKTPIGRSGNANYFIKDPEGHTIEMVQYLPDGWTAKDRGLHSPATRVAVRLAHAGIAVTNLETTLKFYRDILGFKEIWRGSRDGKTLSWVHLQVPEGAEFIELMLETTPERLKSAHHLCFEVPEVAKAAEQLKSRPLPAGCKPPTEIKTGINHKRQINYFDPDGTRVELMEPTTVDGKPAPSFNSGVAPQ